VLVLALQKEILNVEGGGYCSFAYGFARLSFFLKMLCK